MDRAGILHSWRARHVINLAEIGLPVKDRPGRMRESLVFGRSDGFQTDLERVGGWVDRLQPEHPVSRFGNCRSANDSRMRPVNQGEAILVGSEKECLPRGC